MPQIMPIGRVAKLTGVKVPTIRYYEEIGLLPAPPRTDSNRRTYDDSDVRRLKFIRHARELGFDPEAIRELLALAAMPEQPCMDADTIARTHLAETEAKIARLIALREELQAMIERCTHGRVRECRVIEVLADHGECIYEQH
ncbi:MAG: helix-turn-helix domain-containing protein [Methylobacterium sp.]|uniref:MerR family transcriptional regulator n=1 Tax=Methylobacterium sp. TaxID=409 RepID=UPI0025D96688|nr:helix-turn-helix domain-containing protein [Methylobacterium sp.]MBX9934317.1 helix-turn-helix domain-containing protein [Methylobacterium sp.]